MVVAAVIQARMGSTRLPGKVLADVAGRPMLRWVLERARAMPVHEIVLATTDLPEDDAVAAVARAAGVAVVRGEVDDVLARFIRAVDLVAADVVVRLTADDPLKDPQVAADIVAARDGADYASNTLVPSWPEGLDVEVVVADSLRAADAEASLASDREHVTPFVYRQPERFELVSVVNDMDHSAWRWTVDTPQDLAFVRAIWNHFSDDPLTPWTAIAAWLDEHPEVVALNDGVESRGAGYLRSIAAEPPEGEH